jgi:mannose-6-phosphate isomerase
MYPSQIRFTTGRKTMSLYPLKFKPRYVQKMWGGRKLNTVLGKDLPEGTIGESWELYDFPPGVVEGSKDWISSEVAEGPLAGKTLHELVGTYGADLHGSVPLVGEQGQFPILIKFLDAREDLSVQVHPDAAYAEAHPEAHLKSEAWYVVQADADSRLLKGLKAGVTRDSFRKAITDGTVEETINAIPVKAGECFYLPSGTVHALGAGILAAEVQTPSDTTYRVFDFNRIDPSTGKPRTLHVEQALECIDFGPGTPAEELEPTTLVRCDFFTVWKRVLGVGNSYKFRSGEPTVLMILEGRVRIAPGHTRELFEFNAGETMLLPSSVEDAMATATAPTVWLEVRLSRHTD